jgi:hypothetical protein
LYLSRKREGRHREKESSSRRRESGERQIRERQIGETDLTIEVTSIQHCAGAFACITHPNKFF